MVRKLQPELLGGGRDEVPRAGVGLHGDLHGGAAAARAPRVQHCHRQGALWRHLLCGHRPREELQHAADAMAEDALDRGAAEVRLVGGEAAKGGHIDAIAKEGGRDTGDGVPRLGLYWEPDGAEVHHPLRLAGRRQLLERHQRRPARRPAAVIAPPEQANTIVVVKREQRPATAVVGVLRVVAISVVTETAAVVVLAIFIFVFIGGTAKAA
mmetsp:Transcript_26947/g.75952  ORF Transcript_26947/g.75952 Transcript_26947/m.75952 type:complete len:211 (-) Transcript_26947:811-1443(-)